MLCEWSRLPDNAVPLPGLVVVHAVQVVRHQVEGVLEARHLHRGGYRVQLLGPGADLADGVQEVYGEALVPLAGVVVQELAAGGAVVAPHHVGRLLPRDHPQHGGAACSEDARASNEGSRRFHNLPVESAY